MADRPLIYSCSYDLAEMTVGSSNKWAGDERIIYLKCWLTLRTYW